MFTSGIIEKSTILCGGMFHPPDLFTHSQGHWVLVCSITFSLCLILFFCRLQVLDKFLQPTLSRATSIPCETSTDYPKTNHLHFATVQIFNKSTFIKDDQRHSSRIPTKKDPFLALMRSLIGHNLCCLSGRCPEGVGKRTSNCKYQRFNLNTLLLMEEILHQLIGSLSHYLHGFIHPRWLAGFLPSTVWF